MKNRTVSLKKFALLAAIASAVTVVGPAHAADIDTSEVLGYIAAGVVAAGAITAAMMGLVSLIGVGKKAQRAGT